MAQDAKVNPHLDPEPLQQLAQIARPGVVGRMIGTFVDSTTTRIKLLREAAFQGDLDTVRFEAHTLKSSCASVGALQLANLCLQLEQYIDAAGTDDRKIGRFSAQINEEFERLQPMLENHPAVSAGSTPG